MYMYVYTYMLMYIYVYMDICVCIHVLNTVCVERERDRGREIVRLRTPDRRGEKESARSVYVKHMPSAIIRWSLFLSGRASVQPPHT